MTTSGARVEGMGKLRAALSRLESGMKAGGTEAVRLTADDVADLARRDVAVDEGELLESIHVEQVTAEESLVVADAPHAGFVEFGTADTAPQPFMTPAAELARLALVKNAAAQVRRRVR